MQTLVFEVLNLLWTYWLVGLERPLRVRYKNSKCCTSRSGLSTGAQRCERTPFPLLTQQATRRNSKSQQGWKGGSQQPPKRSSRARINVREQYCKTSASSNLTPYTECTNEATPFLTGRPTAAPAYPAEPTGPRPARGDVRVHCMHLPPLGPAACIPCSVPRAGSRV